MFIWLSIHRLAEDQWGRGTVHDFPISTVTVSLSWPVSSEVGSKNFWILLNCSTMVDTWYILIYHIPWLCVYNLLMWYCGYTWILYAIFVVYFCVLTPNYCQAVPCLVRNYNVWDPVGTVGAAQTGLFSCSKPITAKKPEWILYRACLWLAFRISDS